MYAFLDPMFARCFLIMVVCIILYGLVCLEDSGWSLAKDLLVLVLMLCATTSFVGFVFFLLKGI